MWQALCWAWGYDSSGLADMVPVSTGLGTVRAEKYGTATRAQSLEEDRRERERERERERTQPEEGG